MKTSLNIVFAGTPEFGIPCLEALQTSHHHLTAIYTQPDRPAGRGQRMQESAVKVWGRQHHYQIQQPVHFKSPEAISALEACHADVMVVIAYGLILPQSILAIPRLGCVNVHASLLPRWRGAAPIQQAILSGDTSSGISIMQMDVGMDTGPVFTTRTCPILLNDTAVQLHHRLSLLAPDALIATLDALAEGRVQPIAQNNAQATYAPKIQKADAAIDWHQPAAVIDKKIRAYYPWPIAFAQIQNGVIRIHHAKLTTYSAAQAPGTIIKIDADGILVSAAQDAILLTSIQFPGGRAMSIADYLNGQRQEIQVGMQFQ